MAIQGLEEEEPSACKKPPVAGRLCEPSGGMRKVTSKSGVAQGPSPRSKAAPRSAAAEPQVAGFISKFEPTAATLIRQCRRALRRLLPTAIELVYDNYNFFVIGYASTERASDCIVSLAAAANGVGLSFYYGAGLEDPCGLLLGSGKQNRFIRLPAARVLSDPAVVELIRAAIANAKTPLPKAGGGYTLVKSISQKQRSRRKSPHAF